MVAGGSLRPWGLPKEWDLFYSNQGGEWNDYARNWTLAKACFKRLITEMNIKVCCPYKASPHLGSNVCTSCLSRQAVWLHSACSGRHTMVFSEESHPFLCVRCQVVVMGRDLTKEEDHDLAPLIASGHITTHQPSTQWKDFLRYIESSR